MKRWGKPSSLSLVAVFMVALTLGAGAVIGGSDSRDRRASEGGFAWVHEGDEDGKHEVRVFRWGGGPRLGVVIDEVSPEKAKAAGLDRPHGALVREVEKDSAAARAGIEAGDLIVGYDGQRISGLHALMRMVRETPDGRIVTVELVRDGQRRSVEAEIRAPERGPNVYSLGGEEGGDIDIDVPDIDIRIPHVMNLRHHRPRLGVSVDAMNPQLAEFLGVKREGGAFVKEVIDDTPAQRAGIKAGDVIVEVDGRKVQDVGDLSRVLSESEGRTIRIVIVRDGSERTVEAAIAEDEDGDWEEGRRIDREHQREALRALREARQAQREALDAYRGQLQGLRQGLREERRRSPYFTRAAVGRVEI